MPTTEPFGTVIPLTADMADDPEMVESLRTLAVDAWYDQLRRAGGTPVTEPEVQRAENVSYGWPRSDRDGEPLLDEDGQPLIDTVKAYLRARGMAVRP